MQFDTTSAQRMVNMLLDPEDMVDACSVTVQSQAVHTRDAAWDALRGFIEAGASGWCSTTDRVHRIDRTFDLSAAQAYPLLDAELRVSDAQSVQIRHLGTSWQVTTCIEGDGDTHWMQRVKRRGIDPCNSKVSDGRVLTYRVYWQVDLFEAGGCPQIQPCAVRFMGLSEEN